MFTEGRDTTLGLGLLSLLVILEGNARWWGLVGVLPVATGLTGWCPAYALFGIHTCGMQRA